MHSMYEIQMNGFSEELQYNEVFLRTGTMWSLMTAGLARLADRIREKFCPERSGDFREPAISQRTTHSV